MGRPQLFPDGRQVSVLLDPETYQQLSELVERERRERPNYSYGDLLRRYIRASLNQQFRRRNGAPDPRANPVERLNALARGLRRIAKELENAKRN